MSKKTAGDDSDVIYSINYSAPYPRQYFLQNRLKKDITPSRLIRSGFDKINSTTYQKSFSNIFSFKVSIARNKLKSCEWIFNEANFKIMLSELKSLKSFLESETEKAYREMLWFRANKNDPSSRTKFDEFCSNEGVVKNKFYSMKDNFLNKYREFLDVATKAKAPPPAYRNEFFFFDACTTVRQLRLYFNFIELYLDIFITMRRPLDKKINANQIRAGIGAYYTGLFILRRVRELYVQGLSLQEIRKQLPMVGEKTIEKITTDKTNKKGWAYKISDTALELAGRITGTTPANFKQILKQEKGYASAIRDDLKKTPNIEKEYIRRKGFPVLPHYRLEADKESKEEWKSHYRWSIGHITYDSNKR